MEIVDLQVAGAMTGVIKDVGTPSMAHREMNKRWRLIDAVSGGTEKMRELGRELLRPNSAETYTSYERRLHGTYLYEGFNLSVETLLGKPFSEDVTVNDAVKNGPLGQYLNNIDMCGNDITTVSKNIAEIGLRKGIVHVLVDYKNTSQLKTPISIADKKRMNLRPYTVTLDPEQILGWRFDLDGSAPILSMVRIQTMVCIPVGAWGEKLVRQVQVFERVVVDNSAIVSCTTYQHNGKNPDGSDAWVDKGITYITSDVIPLVTMYFGRQEGFFQARPPLMGVVWLNLEHWQSSSEQRNILNVARCPIWFFAGYDETTDDDGTPINKVTISPDAMIKCTDPNATLKIVEHTGACINAGRQDLLDIEARMAHMSVDLLTKKSTSSSSATEKAHDNSGEDSKLSTMMKAEEDAWGTILGLMYTFEGEKAPAGQKLVTINTSFGLEPQDASDLQALYNSRMEGLISQATYLAELQRRGVLAANVDLSAEAVSAKKDGPVKPIVPPVAPTVPKEPADPVLTAKAGAGA